jgi:hypothetical protein
MKKVILSGAMLLAFAIAANAQTKTVELPTRTLGVPNNITIIEQKFELNVANILQIGVGNSSTNLQDGLAVGDGENLIDVYQKHGGSGTDANLSRITQIGTFNTTDVSMESTGTGNGSKVEISQYGSGTDRALAPKTYVNPIVEEENYTRADILGNNNSVLVQQGFDGAAVIKNKVQMDITGNDNTVNIEQETDGNEVQLEIGKRPTTSADSDGNDVLVTQRGGNDNYVSAKITGTGTNTFDVDQDGASNNVRGITYATARNLDPAIQNGELNTAILRQYSDNNLIMSSQIGDNNTARVTQVGGGSTLTLTGMDTTADATISVSRTTQNTALSTPPSVISGRSN